MNLKYKNIAISGGAATGKGTLLAGLKPYLAPLGWTFRSGGDLIREVTNEYKNPTASLRDEALDLSLDKRTKELLEIGNLAVESWLAVFIAKHRDDTLRVFIQCSSDAIIIDRVMNRDGVGVSDAKMIVKDRQEDNFKLWKRLYGDYNFWDPKYFHLIIDTYSTSKEQTLHKVLEAMGFSQK